MKTIRSFVLLFLLLNLSLPLAAQKQAVYKAEMLIGNGKNITSAAVEISLEETALKIQRKKKPFEIKYVPYSAVESADYTYSDRPRYTAATLSTIAFGVGALPVFFMKTKKNWLTLNAGDQSAIFQLQSDNYQMLLLGLKSKNLNVSDSGDRDEAADKKTKAAKQEEKEKQK